MNCIQCGKLVPPRKQSPGQHGGGRPKKYCCRQCAFIFLRHANWVKYQSNYDIKHPGKRAENQSCYDCSEQGRAKRYSRHHTPENLIKLKAVSAVGHAIRDGYLVRQPCEVCGNPKSQGHHEDYSKPLEVVWLCQTHHIKKIGRAHV